MADDLKIVIKAELEADEKASAERIKSQLVNISKLVNSGTQKIKLGVELDTDNIQKQAQRVFKNIAPSGNINSFVSQFNAQLDFGSEEIEEMRKRLDGFNIPTSAIQDFVDGIDKGYVGISKIDTTFSEINDNARAVTATIQGITKAGENLSQTISRSFKKAADEDGFEYWVPQSSRNVSNASKNYVQLQKDAANASKAVDYNNALLAQWQNKQKEIAASYQGMSLGVTQMNQLAAAGQKCSDALGELDVNGGKFSDTQKTNVNIAINAYDKLANAIIANSQKQDKAVDSNIAQFIKWEDKISQITQRYQQSNLSEDQLNSIGARLSKYEDKIADLDIVSGKFTQAEIADVDSVIKKYGQLVNEILSSNKAAEASSEKRQVAATKLRIELDEIESKYKGLSSPTREVKDDKSLEDLSQRYEDISEKIAEMEKSNNAYSQTEVANIKKEIKALDLKSKEYSNIEKAATALRTKSVGEIKDDELGKLKTLEETLRSNGILTDEFQSKIGKLRGQLNSVTDSNGIFEYEKSLTLLDNDIDLFKAKLQGVNSIYQKLIANIKEQTTIQSKLTTDFSLTDTERTNYNSQLSNLKAEQAALEKQVEAYQDVVQYSSKAIEYQKEIENHDIAIQNAESKVKEEADGIAKKMSTVSTSVELAETKFKALTNSTDKLDDKVANLRTLMDSLAGAQSDKEKVAIYAELATEIDECNKQIDNLNSQKRLEIIDSTADDKIKKARADLEAVGRTWSALKSDPGLNNQFNQLAENLKLVESGEMSLKEWTAQFSAFKSQVKAAGKNMQSLGDIIKNNISKVAQWAVATTSIYSIFNKLKQAVSTVIDLDTAMIDLRKTTDETEAAYEKFYLSANETAKALGVTTEEIISQTAAWSRLGYSMSESAKLAEYSSIFASISPDMDVDTATEGLVSIMKAFGYNADEVLDGIISKINEVGNTAALSNADIIEALQDSASAMAVMNGTLDETVALITAAQEVTQDASKVGNAIRSIAMRIRGESSNAPYVQKCA